MSKTQAKTAPTEFESLILVSPSGYQYELTVSDSGNLNVEFKPDEGGASNEKA